MNRVTLVILCIIFLPLKSQTEWIRGKVKNTQGFNVEGCIVTLKNAAVSDTTDYIGCFNIEYTKPKTSVEHRETERAVDSSLLQSESFLLNGRKLKKSCFQNFFNKSNRGTATNRIITEPENLKKHVSDKDKNLVSSQVEIKPFDTLMLHGKFYKDQQIPITKDSSNIEIIMEFDNPHGKNTVVSVEPFECYDQKTPLKYLLTVTGDDFLQRDFRAETDSVMWIVVPPGPDRRFSFKFTDKAGNSIGWCDRTMEIAEGEVCLVHIEHNVEIEMQSLLFPVHGTGLVSLYGQISSTILPIQFSAAIFDQNNNTVSTDAIRLTHIAVPTDQYRIDFKTDLDLRMDITEKACNGTYQLFIEAKQTGCLVHAKQTFVIDSVKYCK
jgi:hypothetical protein